MKHFINLDVFHSVQLGCLSPFSLNKIKQEISILNCYATYFDFF